MQLTFDETADAVYVYFSENVVARTHEINDHVSIDYDDNDEPVGVEFLDVSDGIDLDNVPFRAEVSRLLEESHIKQYA